MPRSRAEQEKVCFSITGAFEGEGYTETTGNFDGQGWSLGIIQWAMGQGKAQQLIRAIASQLPATYIKVLGKEMSAELIRVCGLPIKQAVAWCDERSVGEAKHRIEEPWAGKLKELFRLPEVQAIQRHLAQEFMADARRDCAHYGLNTLRDLAFFFDVAVQNGQGKLGSNASVQVRTLFGAKGGYALDQARKRKALAEVVAETCNPRWKAVVWARKSAIVEGRGVVYGGAVDLEKKYGPLDEVLA